MEVKVYKDAVAIWENLNFNSEMWLSLPEDQKKLAKHHIQCLTIGKKGRHVPIIMDLKMKAKVDILIHHRDKLGLPDNNKYLFGTPGRETHFRSWAILNTFCTKFGTGSLTSTSLRRYLATSLQALDLSDQHVSWVAR